MKVMQILAGFFAIWLAAPTTIIAHEAQPGMSQSVASGQQNVSAEYTSPEGIQFISYSMMWTEEALKGLYRTLLKCGHGEELAQLKKVILTPTTSTGESGFRVGNYDVQTQTIRLYEVEASAVERTLIHEYGHHFTYYWLQQKEALSPERLTELSAWSKIRQLSGYPIRWFGVSLPYMHKWDPNEIMAEDYVMLFGVGGAQLPEEAEGTVNLLRHENEYIPSAQSIPELRRYWEKLAGLVSPAPVQVPKILQWSPANESNSRYKLAFSSAATLSQQLIKYGIRVTAIDDETGGRMNWTTGVSARGQSSIEATLDFTSFQRNQNSFRFLIQIWALDPESKQLAYTPMYGNWFAYDGAHRALTAIAPPFEAYGLNNTLKKEGMDKWPLLNLFVDGKPTKILVRREDGEGNVYVPLRLFTQGGENSKLTRDPLRGNTQFDLTAQFNNHKVELQMNQTHAFVNDTRIELLQKMMLKDQEALVSISDLPQLFGVRTRWTDADSSLFIEAQ